MSMEERGVSCEAFLHWIWVPIRLRVAIESPKETRDFLVSASLQTTL